MSVSHKYAWSDFSLDALAGSLADTRLGRFIEQDVLPLLTGPIDFENNFEIDLDQADIDHDLGYCKLSK